MASGVSGGTAFDGSWHSVAFRRNGTAFELFVDGTRVATTTATLATGSTCNRTTLMHMLMSGPTAYAKGSIQHAAIWNTALSDSEIMAIQTARTLGRTYSTNFPLTENPISEGGNWVAGQSAGNNLWGDIQTNGTIAFGVSLPTAYGDPTGILTGPWGPDQTAQAVVRVSQVPFGTRCHEVELRLRTTINPVDHTITGYEIFCSVMPPPFAYCSIGTWGGPNGIFWARKHTLQRLRQGWRRPQGRRDGHEPRYDHRLHQRQPSHVGPGQRAVLGQKRADHLGPWTTGSPGIGFFDDNGDRRWRDFGFSSFSAHD